MKFDAMRTADELLGQTLRRVDLAPIAGDRTVRFEPMLATSFMVDAKANAVLVGPAAMASASHRAVAVRHALELCLMLERCEKDDAVLAGLLAARTAALYASLEFPAAEFAALAEPYLRLVADVAPDVNGLQAVWNGLVFHQPGAPTQVTREAAARLTAFWPLLGPAEYLMGVGGDARIRVDPASGLNAFGCSPRPRPWATTFASSTASSVSERGYAGAELARCRLLCTALASGVDRAIEGLFADVRAELANYYRLSADSRIVLTASGTDGELCALALAVLGDSAAPLSNVLVAPEETGAGVPLAATGKHFDARTAGGAAVEKGTRIDGFPGDVELECVPLRTREGAVREAVDVQAECDRKVARAIANGRRVMLHIMDQSKTGLRGPLNVSGTRPNAVDVLVDACQARLTTEAIADYLRRGFMVLVTGSKFFTGPPFSGALLLPGTVAARLEQSSLLPSGLADYCGRHDWPEASACRVLQAAPNIGVPLRWAAALAEMRAFEAVDPSHSRHVLSTFVATVQRAIAANRDLWLHEVPPLRRGPSDRWDDLQTIVTFSVKAEGAADRGQEVLDVEQARQVYRWLNSDLSAALPASATREERELASRHFHIGQPVGLASARGPVGALRISAGARLVSGEPSQAGVPPTQRLEGEIADALAGLRKISLIVKYLDAVRRANPRPQFAHSPNHPQPE